MEPRDVSPLTLHPRSTASRCADGGESVAVHTSSIRADERRLSRSSRVPAVRLPRPTGRWRAARFPSAEDRLSVGIMDIRTKLRCRDLPSFTRLIYGGDAAPLRYSGRLDPRAAGPGAFVPSVSKATLAGLTTDTLQSFVRAHDPPRSNRGNAVPGRKPARSAAQST